MSNNDPQPPDLRRRHLVFGWWSLFVFLGMGLVLEALHGFKVDWYLDVGLETRREMWTLAHAHGTLLGLVNLAFAVIPGLDGLARSESKTWRRVSWLLVAGTLLMPAGFFLGGIKVYGGDPSLGILWVPVGGLCLLVGVGLTALRVGRVGRGGRSRVEDAS